ncbi:phage tail tape measure protein [Arthrobacter bambusae]|uniref:phage tail tape measure protein n=1 Tax=Arthrobacter bambusae TaxID=1338426 RepID=UPI00277EC7BC|nr:phage tail tape measure protein [Arthrobacter bambusae]MDQ0241159.1 TP901 family phage tail tape measure protein [Arthrobacter bambusae]
MSFLPPVVMEMRANASQFLTEQGKVIASAKATATETEKAAQKEAAAARTSAAEATRAAEQKTAAAETSAKAAVVATDRRIAAEAKATEAQAKAAQMQAALSEKSTAEQQAAYDKQVAAAERAANAVSLAAAKESEAQGKAAAAATASAEAQTKAASLQVVAAEKTAAAQEVAATRTKVAMNSVVGVANKISAVSILAAGAVAIGSLEMASKFEKSTMLLVTAGGEQMSALAGVRQGILDISTQTGTSAEQMSEGMYIMEKAGFRGAAGLAALKASAEGAKDENVDLQVMAQATTDVLLDYGYKMDTAAHATDSSVRVTNMLVAASGAAKTTMQDFAGSMSAIVPIASTAKISFAEVGGAIATMTQHGQTAQQSSQNLANLVMSLIRPNNLASAAMSQLGIDTTDLAQHLGDRGLSGSLKIVDDAIKAHTKDGMVFTGTMKDNANAAKAMDTIMGQMSPTMAQVSQGLKDGTVSQKEYTKEVKGLGGEAGALGNQFLTLYKANSGVTDSLKAGKPAYETYNAALRDTLGNVTAMRAAQMLLMNNGREFEANIKAIGDAGKKTGSDISTWADMQSTLSVKMNQTEAMVQNLGIELGTKLVPAAKDAVGGFTDLVHGFEQGNPVLLGIAGVIGGALTISAVNFGIQMGKTVVKTVSGLVDMGATAIAQSALFVSGMTADEIAVGSFSTKAELAGAKVKGMGGMMLGAATGFVAVAAAATVMSANTNHATVDVEKMTKALTDFSDAGNAAGKSELNTMFSTWDTMFGASTSNIKGLDDALQHVIHPSGLEQAYAVTDGFASSIGLAKTALGQAQDKVKGMGDELGKLAGSNLPKAQSAFQQLALHTDGSKESLQKLLDSMPGYKDALQSQVDATGKQVSQQELLEYAYGKIPKAMQDAAGSTAGFTDAIGRVHPITPELQKSLDDAGVSADGLATDLGKVLDGMLQTGMKTETARAATGNFNKTIEDAKNAIPDLVKQHVDLSNALNDTSTDFNLADEGGRQLNDRFTSVKDKGIEVAKSMVGQGKDSVVGALQDTYDNMINAANAEGIHGQAAVDLTRNLLGIPKNVDVKTWMDSQARDEANKLQNSLDKLPTYKNVAVNVQYTESGTAVRQHAEDAGGGRTTQAYASGGLVAFAGGGMVGGYPGGGLLSGPGSGTSDSMLARVSNGEFIVRQAAVQKYGVGFLSQINRGALAPAPGYAGATGSASPTGMSHQSSGSPQVTINAQTNATAGQIANELAWVLRTS